MPNSGIVLDIIPYVAIVLIAAAGIMVLISKKKRSMR
jgi:hypothetical protein